jgi:hypothetical protein
MSGTEEKDYAFHEEWIWLGNEDNDFGSYISADKNFPYVASSISELHDENEGGKNSNSEWQAD